VFAPPMTLGNMRELGVAKLGQDDNDQAAKSALR
jgi:hypothetical protein